MTCPFTRAGQCLKSFNGFSERLLPLALLLARLKLGSVFLLSGWLALGYILHGETNIFYAMFEDYKIPFFSSHIGAWAGMAGELVFGVMVTLGFCARLSAVGLIVMSLIFLQSDGNSAVYCMLLSAIIATAGPGRWSVDALVCREKPPESTTSI